MLKISADMSAGLHQLPSQDPCPTKCPGGCIFPFVITLYCDKWRVASGLACFLSSMRPEDERVPINAIIASRF